MEPDSWNWRSRVPFGELSAPFQPLRSARAAGLGARGKGRRRQGRGRRGGAAAPLPPNGGAYSGYVPPSSRSGNAAPRRPCPCARVTRSQAMDARAGAAAPDVAADQVAQPEAQDSSVGSTAENVGDFTTSDGDSTELNEGNIILPKSFSTGRRRRLVLVLLAVMEHNRRMLEMARLLAIHEDKYLLRAAKKVVPGESGAEWVERTAADWEECYKMFRMRPYVFELLHDVLVQSYGLKSTTKMSSREALGMVLWMLGAPQSVRQAENWFRRSTGTVSTKFREVIGCLLNLAKDNVCPKDPTYSTVHPVVANHRYGHAFRNAIGALDGTHVKVCVPGHQVGKYINRKSDKTQNVLAIVDFDRRFTFVAAGIPGSAHDYRVLNEARRKFGSNFPHPPPGKYYLADAGYPNRPGYLAPYRGVKYHQEDWRRGPGPRDKKEVFNQAHASLWSAVECSFAIWKNKWRMLKAVPSYPEAKQTHIILACAALHNFVMDYGQEEDEDKQEEGEHEDGEESEEEENLEDEGNRGDQEDEGNGGAGSSEPVAEDVNMNVVRDEIANECFEIAKMSALK